MQGSLTREGWTTIVWGNTRNVCLWLIDTCNSTTWWSRMSSWFQWRKRLAMAQRQFQESGKDGRSGETRGGLLSLAVNLNASCLLFFSQKLFFHWGTSLWQQGNLFFFHFHIFNDFLLSSSFTWQFWECSQCKWRGTQRREPRLLSL